MGSSFGERLKQWRQQKRFSQLALAGAADVSARHISFLETGRANASRQMVLHLCEILNIPLEQRNHALAAAGFSPAYVSRDLASEDMSFIREAIDWTLRRHAPFPALALDQQWQITALNSSAQTMFGLFGVKEGCNMLTLLLENESLQQAIENWPEVAHHMMIRLQTESQQAGSSDFIDKAISGFQQYADGSHSTQPLPAVTPVTYSLNGEKFSFVTLISQFGSMQDLALAQTKIELMFPADAATRRLFMDDEAAE